MYNYSEIADVIKNADSILISASNGLSITEGLHLFADNAAFDNLFGDFKKKYGLSSILQCMSSRFPTDEEKWLFWSRLINHYCVNYKPTKVMEDLKAIVGNKDYFIVTSNGECHFELCGFDSDKIYEVEGNWLTMQCGKGCHSTLYPTLDLTKKMAKAENNGKIPAELIPHCPKCGSSMEIHMIGENYIPDIKPRENFEKFLREYHNKNLVVLELGIGWRNQLIKAPLMNLVAREPKAKYVTINLGEIYILDSIKDRSYGLDGYLEKELDSIRKEM